MGNTTKAQIASPHVTLQEIMNDVSSFLDAGAASVANDDPAANNNTTRNTAKSTTPPNNARRRAGALPREPLCEMMAFCRLDPLLAELHKQYLDAKSLRAQAIREYGADDGMSDMACINEDSAWCAVQTRYMELRCDRALMAQAQGMVADEAYEIALEKRLRDEAEALKTFYLLQLAEQMAEKRKPKDGLLLLIWFLSIPGIQNGPAAYQWFPTYHFNRIAA